MFYPHQTEYDGICHRTRSIPTLAAFFLFLILFFSASKPRQVVTLALLGDLMLGRGVNPNLDSLAYLAPELSAADLALSNLESPLASHPPAFDSTYNLCASSVNANLLPTWGLDLLSIVNNHANDCIQGAQGDGQLQTSSLLEAIGITAIGPTMQPIYREVNGLQLAFFAFDDVSSSLDTNAAVQSIRLARSTGALVIISIHWGAEYQAGSSDRQESLAKEFANAGAVLVWGHHPHVLQPVAWIGAQPCKGPNSSQGCALVLCSLGNALFDQGGLEDTRRSAMVVVSLNRDGVSGIRVAPFEIDILNSRVIRPDSETKQIINERLFLP